MAVRRKPMAPRHSLSSEQKLCDLGCFRLWQLTGAGAEELFTKKTLDLTPRWSRRV